MSDARSAYSMAVAPRWRRFAADLAIMEESVISVFLELFKTQFVETGNRRTLNNQKHCPPVHSQDKATSQSTLSVADQYGATAP